ncbi:MAG: hypothetical protein A2X23_05985 [Chloroflexi bacterium GWC2_73_18]|nr:MAG: hypothetical protein A2X23_05985 [Chloroflexi bacterium GWC2_73_18]
MSEPTGAVAGPPETIRYLAAADVVACMPPLEERLALADRVLRAIVTDAELPPKIGVHPRPDSSFGHAMPAYLPGPDASGDADLVGMKWVVGFPTNSARGLGTINALVLLNDPVTGFPVAVLDGGPITAQRTAAVSGVAIRAFAPAVAGRPCRAALIGAGVQGHSHVPVIGHVLPGVELALHDTDPERAAALAAEARRTAGIGAARVAGSAREAVGRADVVVTAAAFGPVRQVMGNDWLAPGALVVAVDYATYVAAEVAREAALFLVDESRAFLANRDAGLFDGYPDPPMQIGEALLAGTSRPDGRVLVTHLGVGLSDLVFGDAILRTAEASGRGILLPR